MPQQVVVITRQLPGFNPVVSQVVLIPEEAEHEEGFAAYRTKDIQKDLCSNFLEFENATWNYSIHSLKEVTF